MELTCTACDSGTGSDGNPCIVCGGDGVIDLIDPEFGTSTLLPKVYGVVWDAILTSLASLESDMATIKTQIQALYDDLNP